MDKKYYWSNSRRFLRNRCYQLMARTIRLTSCWDWRITSSSKRRTRQCKKK